MTRNIIILLTLSLFSLTIQAQEEKKENLKGKIKLITLYGYEAAEKKSETLKDKLTTKTTFHYDEYGNLTEANYYDLKTNSIFSKDNRKYDDNGNMIEITFYDRTGETGKYVYKYDNYNHEIEKTTYWKGKFDGKVITNYDYKSMIVKVNYYQGNGALQNSNSYKLDDKGNHLEDYDSNGKIISKSTYQYDTKGRIEKEYYESSEEELTKGIIKLEYDEWDNEVKRINMEMNGEIISINKTEYVYDKFGNWIQQVKTWSYNTTRQTEKKEIEYY